ncbi:hypothetical protein BDW74DRAFT_183545 [Aspergillus multicolor]|uniref:uncharacterized protein n=1 Tax=Aspergillus multicolor TaxID=41759 RepID=UPI003CCD5DA6
MNGLREAGLFDALLAKKRQEDAERRAAKEAAKSEEQRFAGREPPAPYISTLKVLFRWCEPKKWSDWGFVVFRAGQYGDEHEERWNEFRRRWELIFEQDFDKFRGFQPKSDRAIEFRFDEMRNDLPRPFATTACLMVTPDVIDSVLHSPLPSSAFEPQSKAIPFVIAVSAWAHKEQNPSFKGYFRVAVESLIHGFYAIVALDTMHLSELAEPMRDDREIWLDDGRDGIRYRDDILNPPKSLWADLA